MQPQGQNTGVGSLSLLQGIFPTQGSNPGLPTLQADSSPAEPQGKPNEWSNQEDSWAVSAEGIHGLVSSSPLLKALSSIERQFRQLVRLCYMIIRASIDPALGMCQVLYTCHLIIPAVLKIDMIILPILQMRKTRPRHFACILTVL